MKELDEKTETICFRTSVYMRTRLAQVAKNKKRDVSDLIRLWLEEKLEKEPFK